MDTSIAFLLIAAVLFVVIVPALLKRSSEQNGPALPERVRTVDVERTQRCAVDGSRPQLLRDGSHPARVELPAPIVPVDPQTPRLSLRAARPELAVVDGAGHSDATTSPGRDEVSAEARAAEAALPQALPLAVGAAPLLDLSADHRPSAQTPRTADVIALSTLQARAALTGPTDSDSMDITMTSAHRPSPRRVAAAAERMPRDLPADVRARLAQPAPQRSTRVAGTSHTPTGARRASASARESASARPAPLTAAPDGAARKKIRRLRSVLPVAGLSVLVLALATLVCTGFVIFGSLPWGAPVVTAALTLAALALVRGLNLEIRALRTGTAAEAAPASATTRSEHSAPTAVKPRRPAPVARRESLETPAVDDEPITADLPIVRETASAPSAPQSATAAARTAEDRTDQSRTAAAESRAAATVTDADVPDMDTTVRAATDTDAHSTDAAGTDTAPATDAEAAETEATEQAASTGPRTRSVFAGAAPSVTGTTIAESLARRRAPGEWTPAVLPAPRYADAAPAEHAEPAPVVADASSYSLSPADKESLAEQFAEELGYRPALADAAAEVARTSSGPLEHGRTAIRGSGERSGDGAESSRRTGETPAQLRDILARRRA